MALSEYTVIAERDGDWWSLQAKELPGAISQVRELGDYEVIREAIAFISGEPESEVSLRLEVHNAARAS